MAKMKLYRDIRILAAAALTGWLCNPVSAACAAGIQLELMEKAFVSGPTIVLQDIVHLPRGTEVLLDDKMLNMELGRAPAPGASRIIDPEYIALKFKQNGIDSTDFVWGGSDGVLVSRKTKVVSSEEIVECARKFVLERMPWEKDDVILDIKNKPEALVVADTDTILEVVTRPQSNFQGRMNLQVKVSFGPGEYSMASVSMSVRRFARVLVSKKHIPQGSVLDAEDFILQREEVTDDSRDALMHTQDIAGKTAKTSISANQIIYASMLDKQKLVKKNDTVTVLFDTSLISITMKAVAMEDGREGDIIQVRNIDSHKIFDVQVVSNVVVRIMN
jgi:flagellar basal body P-ring formation protein FlgA